MIDPNIKGHIFGFLYFTIPGVLVFLAPFLFLGFLTFHYFKKFKTEENAKYCSLLVSLLITCFFSLILYSRIFWKAFTASTAKDIKEAFLGPYVYFSLIHWLSILPAVLAVFILSWGAVSIILGVINFYFSKIKKSKNISSTFQIGKKHFISSILLFCISLFILVSFIYHNKLVQKVNNSNHAMQKQLLKNTFVKIEGKFSNEINFWASYDSTDATVVMSIASTTDSKEVLRKLSHHQERVIRTQVAINSNTPKSILRRFYEEKSVDISGLARNPSTPSDILRSIYKNHSHAHGHLLIDNPNTPKDILEKKDFVEEK